MPFAAPSLQSVAPGSRETADEWPDKWASFAYALVFKTKEELALDLIQRAVDDGVPGEVVLADRFYGRSHDFRDFVRNKGLD
jgi:SRSO17 transposase